MKSASRVSDEQEQNEQVRGVIAEESGGEIGTQRRMGGLSPWKPPRCREGCQMTLPTPLKAREQAFKDTNARLGL